MSNKYRRVIEVNGKENISLPIVKFPPFALRAAMVEKDPVIWLHLLEVYVEYFKYLLKDDNLDFLDDSSVDHLCIFIRSFLHELSDEEGKLLSLGVNADVLKQLEILRAYVLHLIKSCGLLYLQISTDNIWDIVRIYVKDHADSVRSLISGSLKPTINTQKAQINRTYQLQQHIRYLIEANNFDRVDLKALEYLIEPNIKRKAYFADSFVSTKWVESLETMFGKEPGSYLSIWGKKLGLLSFLTCSVNHMVKLVHELGITNIQTLTMYPLLGSILIDKRYHAKVPSITRKLPFLSIVNVEHNNDTSDGLPSVADESQILSVQELFPHLHYHQLSELLQRYDNNSETLINNLLENPSIADSIEIPTSMTSEKHNEIEDGKPEIRGTENFPEIKISDKIISKSLSSDIGNVPDALRNKTLNRALSLLYDATEDERDDTYDEAEVKKITADRINVDAKENTEENHSNASKYDRIEGYLWELLKKDKSLFTRQSRGSKVRKEMKKETTWSDEQIEGWSRMIEKSPKRAQLLEEKYIFKGNIRKGKTSYTKSTKNTNEGDENSSSDNSKSFKPRTNSTQDYSKQQSPKEVSQQQQKRQFARNEKNKSSRANHNRKAGHDKKLAKSSAV